MKKSSYEMSLYQKKYRYGSAKKEESDIEITSLLDILVILLFFLIKYYNSSDLKVDLVNKLDVPFSVSKDLGSYAVIVQINAAREIYVEGKMVGSMGTKSGEEQFGQYLSKIKSAAQAREVANSKEKETSAYMNIVMDKELTYDTMERVMQISTKYQYANFRFIVKGDG